MPPVSKFFLGLLALSCLSATWMASPGKGSHGSAAALTFAEVQQKNFASAVSATSHNLVFDATPAQNNLIVIAVVSDAVVTTLSGYSSAVSAVNITGIYIFYKVAGAGESTTVALALSGSSSATAVGFEYSGMATASPLDKTASNTSGSGATISTGTTATTAQANELLVAVTGHSTTGSVAIVSGWSNSFLAQANISSTVSTTNVGNGTATLQVSSTGAYTTTSTWDATLANWGGCIATFKITNP